MSQTAVPQWISRELQLCGVSHVFFLEAILRDTLIDLSHHGVRPILAHTEAAAAYMADGYARVSRQPGICMSQSVGAANLAAALQDAWLGRSPVLAITGRKPQALQDVNAYQEVDHRRAFSATTKLSLYAQSPDMVPRVFTQAWRALHSGVTQPVHIDVEGLMGEYLERGACTAGAPGVLAGIAFDSTAPEPSSVLSCAELIASGRRVVVVAGYEAARVQVGPRVQALAERLHAPVATTVGAKGLLDTEHPLHIGTVGSYGMAVTNRVVHEADVVIAIGCQLSDQNTHGGTAIHAGQTLIQLDRNLSEIGKSYPHAIPLVGGLSQSLDALLQALPEQADARDTAYVEGAARAMAEWREQTRQVVERNTHPIRVERIIHEISQALPEDGILVADTGYSAIWTAALARLNGRGQDYLRAAGSLGWAFPAAIGAKCAAGSRPVICFVGDGAFYYHLSEIETALRHDIPLVVVVNNNHGFGQDSVNMHRRGLDRDDVAMLASFEKQSFADIARSFGANGIRVTRPEDIGAALRSALDSQTLTIVEVITPIDAAAPDAWLPPAPAA